MKMRYIILSVVLFFVANLRVSAQKWESTGLNIVGGTAIKVVYGEEIAVYDFVIPYYKDGSNYYWCPGTLKLYDNSNDKLLFKSEMLSVQQKETNKNGINIVLSGLCDVQQGAIECHLEFEPNGELLDQELTVGDGRQQYLSIRNKKSPALYMTMYPRPIKIDPDSYDDNYSSKIYDGGTTVKDGFITNFKPDTYYSTDDTKNKTGILTDDVNDVSFDIKSAAYKNKNCAGETKSEIEVEFQNTGLKGSKAGNYELVFDDPNNKKLNFPGTIEQKNLPLNLTFTKDYDGTTDAALGNKKFTHTDNTNIIENEEIEISSATGSFESPNASADVQTVNNIQVVYATNDGHSNYAITFNGSGTITKQSLNLVLGEKFVYETSKIGTDIIFQKPKNAQNQEVDGTFELYKDNNRVNYNVGDNLGVGNYKVVFVPTDATNYNNAEKEFEVESKKLALTIQFEKEYDGNNILSNNITSYIFPNKLLNDDVHISSLSATVDNVNVEGVHNITVSSVILSNTNYVVDNDEITSTGTIKPKVLTFNNLQFEKTYDGGVDASSCYRENYSFNEELCSPNGVKDDVEIQSLTAAFDDKNASTGFTKKVSVSNVVLSNSNYEVKNFEKENSGKINKKILTPSFAFQKVYDGNDVATNSLTSEFANKKLTHDNCTDVLEGEEVEFDFTKATFTTSNKCHQDGIVSIDDLSILGNYSKNYEFGQYTTSGSITKQPITIFPLNDFTYGGSIFGTNINPTVSATNPAIEGTFTAHLKNSTATYKKEELPMLLAGEYTISYTPNDTKNYEVTNNNSVGFEVKPKEINVTLSFEKIYDGDNDVKEGNYISKLKHENISEILENDEVIINFTSATFYSKDVHTEQDVTANVTGFQLLNGNYKLGTFSATSTITKKPLTLNLDFTKTFDGNEDASFRKEFSISDKPDDIILGDKINLNATAKFTSENYNSSIIENSISLEYGSGDQHSNYDITVQPSGTINKKNIQISLTGSPFTYGAVFGIDVVPTLLDENTLPISVDGNFSAVQGNDSYNSGVLPAGTYDVVFTPNKPDNYYITNNKQFVVNKRETSIKLSYAKDKIYDATTTVLGFSGVINNLIDADKNLINVSAEYEDKNVGVNRIDFTISALELFKQNYACENAKIYNSNNVEIGHLDANCSFQFNNAADCIGKISQCEITINSTQNITKPYDGTTDVENFTVTGFSVAGNDNSVTFSPTTDYSLPEIEGKIYANEKIRITPTAEYNSKNVSEANKITITGTVDNDNYKVVPRKIEPATITPSVVTVTQNKKPTKTYDGDNSVKSFSDCYEVNGIFKNAQGYDEVQFLYNDASIKYTSVNAGTNIALDFSDANIRLEPVDNNYTLSVGEFYGDIKRIKPTIRWFIRRGNGDEEVTNLVSMSYGMKVGTNDGLYAMIDEVDCRNKYPAENCSYAVVSGHVSIYDIGNGLLLSPGACRLRVIFKPTDADAVNYETVSSEINLEITFAWQFGHEVNSNYGSSIGNEIKFYYSGIGLSESDLEYTYFLDGKEVPKGYIPKVGPHKLYCKVKHATLGNTQTEEINFTIEPRVLVLSKYDWVEEEGNKLRRPYDGTTTVYDEQIKELAKIDKDLIISGDEVFFNTDMAYDDEEVGDRVVNVKYSLTGKDSYCYVFDINKMQEYSEAIPGFIKRCPAFVGFKEYDKVYGSSELGKDIVPTTTYVRYKGEKISPEGTCVFEVLHDGNELREYESGKMMNVGVYYMRVKFTPEDQLHYEDGRSNFEYVKVTQKSISATGVTIEDKYYDGTAKVNPVKVKLFDPELDGVIEQDKNNVKLEITNLQDIKYPDVKIGDYQGLVVKVALKGSGIENYKLTNSELKANSSILPFEFHYNVEPDETGVYQFVYGSSVMGKDFKLINELTETQTVRYKISNIDKTNQMLVPNTYKVDVQLYDSDMLVQSQQVMVNVVKLKLLTTVPNIAHAKLHDGTVSVKLTGERCVLTNVVEGDQVEIEKQEQFYDSPDLGTGKTITVSFTLSGAWHSKYIEPDNYVYNDGVITNKNIQIGSVGISGDICPSSNAPIVFDVVEGIPDKASIKFSAEALENGFEDITITNTQFGLNSVELKIPEKAKAGEYTATLYLSSGSDNNFEKVFKFTVNYDASYIISKFSDVVAINNAGYDFVGYQWYKDGHVIETETKQFFNDLPCLYGWYSAKVLTVDGTYANICPRYFDKRTAVSKRANAGVNVYPNPALPMQAVTVELEDFEDYENCTIFIYNLSGVLITKIQNPDRLNTLNLPQGSYTGVVVKDDSRLTFKLIVRK